MDIEIEQELPEHYKKAEEYYMEAEEALKYDNMDKAIPIYREAIKYAQWSLSKTSGAEYKKMEFLIQDARQKIWNFEEKEREKIRQFEERKKEARIRDGIFFGMTKDEVESSWGKPDKIRKSGDIRFGSREEWFYRDKGTVEFQDGVVTKWNDYSGLRR